MNSLIDYEAAPVAKKFQDSCNQVSFIIGATGWKKNKIDIIRNPILKKWVDKKSSGSFTEKNDMFVFIFHGRKWRQMFEPKE